MGCLLWASSLLAATSLLWSSLSRFCWLIVHRTLFCCITLIAVLNINDSTSHFQEGDHSSKDTSQLAVVPRLDIPLRQLGAVDLEDRSYKFIWSYSETVPPTAYQRGFHRIIGVELSKRGGGDWRTYIWYNIYSTYYTYTCTYYLVSWLSMALNLIMNDPVECNEEILTSWKYTVCSTECGCLCGGKMNSAIICIIRSCEVLRWPFSFLVERRWSILRMTIQTLHEAKNENSWNQVWLTYNAIKVSNIEHIVMKTPFQTFI